jgi:hypothetical protein
MPVMRLQTAPAEDQIATLNTEMSCQTLGQE